MIIEKPCEFCGRDLFIVFAGRWPSLIARKRFCNRSCRSSFFWGSTGPAMKEALTVQQARDFPAIEIACAQCGKQFRIPAARLKTAKFCSYGCAGLSYRVDDPAKHRFTSRNGKAVRDHVLIAEKLLRRRLHRSECIHHINGKKRDNGLANLIVLERGQHTTIENLQRHRRCHFSAEDILRKFPNALWLGRFAESVVS